MKGNAKRWDFRREKRRWIPLVDFHTWAIMRMVEHGARGVREMLGEAEVNPNTLIQRLRLLTKWGLLECRRRSTRKEYGLTARGRRLLRLFGRIGDVIKEIRKDA